MNSFRGLFRQYKWLWLICGLAGLPVGLLIYLFYASLAWSYLSDEPTVCLNCHIMGPYYQSWNKSSHAVWANCVDCHIPQDKLIRGYAFKAVDGLYHAAVYTMGTEGPALRPRPASYKVILENCLRCHTPLVTEFAKMSPDYDSIIKGDKKACWDCHREVPHTRNSGLGSNVNVNLPFPPALAPAWLESVIKKQR
jgi:cytochrome c nitrite reductase small subunit